MLLPWVKIRNLVYFYVVFYIELDYIVILMSKWETAAVYAKLVLNFPNLLLLLSYTNSLIEKAVGIKKKFENICLK